MLKKRRPLWREAYFQVKAGKTHQLRCTFGSRDVEKVHAVVARSIFPSQHHVQSRPGSEHLEVEMCKKCTPLWRDAHFEVKSAKNRRVQSIHVWTLRCRLAWQVHGIVHIPKSAQKREGFVAVQKRGQAWDISRGSAKMHLARQAQYKRHAHQRR